MGMAGPLHIFSSTPDRRNLALLALFHFAIFLLLFQMWNGSGQDHLFYYSYLSSPLFDGDLSITNDIASGSLPVREVEEIFRQVHPETGMPLNVWAPGAVGDQARLLVETYVLLQAKQLSAVYRRQGNGSKADEVLQCVTRAMTGGRSKGR